MKKTFLFSAAAAILGICVIALMARTNQIAAQESMESIEIESTEVEEVGVPAPSSPTYLRGTAVEEIERRVISEFDQLYTQRIRVQRADSGAIEEVSVGSEFQPLNKQQLIPVGQSLVLAEQQLVSGEKEVIVADIYRMPTVLTLFAIFLAVVLVIGRWQGFLSVLGMGLSVLILLQFVVPAILSGANPIMISLIGALVIGAVTIYLAHGFNMKSHVAFFSTVLVLGLVAVLSYAAVISAQLVGLGSEEAYFLQFGPNAVINLQGLLLGGIMLGALGVLDDVTVSQVSVVFQLRVLKENISKRELYHRSLAVGRDHVASLVNTLVLAYAGANMPLFLLFVLNEQTPDWVTLNSDIIVEEVVRTLAGSIGLVVAVPIVSAVAVWVATTRSAAAVDAMLGSEGHHHH